MLLCTQSYKLFLAGSKFLGRLNMTTRNQSKPIAKFYNIMDWCFLLSPRSHVITTTYFLSKKY